MTFVGLPNAALEVEALPARTEVDRLADDSPVDTGAGDADGHMIELPAIDELEGPAQPCAPRQERVWI
jgi:hypothetical protein